MASFVMSVLRLEPPWDHKYQGDLRSAEGGVMLGKYKIALAMIGSFAFGAVAAQSLTPRLGLLPMNVVAEVDVKNREKFASKRVPSVHERAHGTGQTESASSNRNPET
jgi:hypothetical protein